MRKLLLVLMCIFIAIPAYASTSPAYMTSNTVSFSTTGLVVTFNSVVNKIIVINESSSSNLHVTFTGLGYNKIQGVYNLPRLQNVTASTASLNQAPVKLTPGQSLTWDISTTKIGFITAGDSGNVQYIATSEVGQP